MKMLTLLLITSFLVPYSVLQFFMTDTTSKSAPANINSFSSNPKKVTSNRSVSTVADVVAKAVAFKATLTSAQITTLEKTFTNALAQNWSNLPCGAMCRNGIQFGNLSAVQLAAAKEVIAAASGTTVNEGYDEFLQINLADSVLQTVGGSGYGKGIYFISFLNTPTATGAWMLQFGGHHYAANIAFNGGQVVGASPTFEGVEPKLYRVASGAYYAPMNQERAGMQVMLASLSTAHLATAKLSTSFSDVLLGPGKDGQFPATKVGIKVSTLTTLQQTNVLNAMLPWIKDVDDASSATLQGIYQNDLANTYISYATNTSAVAGDSSTFLTANTDYVRIDGPNVWIEFVCQNGVVFSGVHYHTIYRDHNRDYGNYLARTTLPLKLVDMAVSSETSGRTISWTTADELNVDHFEVERSDNGSSNFITIGQIAAKNISSSAYSFSDKTATSNGTVYYRIKMVDKDGYSTYSMIKAINNNLIAKLVIFPNPASSTLTLTLASSVTDASINITNVIGKTVLAMDKQSGQKFDINISKLSAGSYFVQVIQNGVIGTKSFIKQ